MQGVGLMGVVPVGDKALEAADADRLGFDAAHAAALALAFLRADAAADGGQGGALGDDLIGGFEVAVFYLFDEGRDVNIDGATRDAGHIFAVETARGFVERLLGGIARGDFVKVVDAGGG